MASAGYGGLGFSASTTELLILLGAGYFLLKGARNEFYNAPTNLVKSLFAGAQELGSELAPIVAPITPPAQTPYAAIQNNPTLNALYGITGTFAPFANWITNPLVKASNQIQAQAATWKGTPYAAPAFTSTADILAQIKAGGIYQA